MTVNKVILVGNLGADPEMRTTQGGMTIASLRLATTERRKGSDGEWSDHTEWHRVAVFGRTAENVQRFCKKGKQVYVEGKIRTNEYTDKDGNRRFSTEIVADEVRFLGGGGGGGEGRAPARDERRETAAPVSGGGYGGGAPDDDIPF